MIKQTFQLKDVDIPDGYEATGEFRVPALGETILVSHGGLCMASVCGWNNRHAYLILRKAWVAPKCFPDGYWVFWGGLYWWLSDSKPRFTVGDTFATQVDRLVLCAEVFAKFHGETFTPPGQNCIQVVRDGR